MDIQERVRTLFDRLVAEDKERGLQLAVYHRGRRVVDAWAGWTDASCTVPVDGDTLFPVFSVSKGIAATVVHRLVERGLLDDDAPLATVWPEFAANGKEAITLRQVMSHSAGLSHLPAGLKLEDLADWERMAAAMAKQRPETEPGRVAAYHAITYSWLVGEPACRVTGKDFPTLLEEEVKAPLGLRDLYIGLPAGVDSPIAVLEEVGPEQEFPPDDSPAAIPWWTQPLYRMMNRPDMQAACIPATSGLMSARALARHYAALSETGVDGVRLLSSKRLAEATTPQTLADGTATGFGLGYAVGRAVTGERLGAFGHGGHGGSEGHADRELGIAFGFTRNRLRDPSGTATGSLVAEMIREYAANA